MNKKWTIKDALRYIDQVDKGVHIFGLKYLSARDYIKNHTMRSTTTGDLIDKRSELLKKLAIGLEVTVKLHKSGVNVIFIGKINDIDDKKESGHLVCSDSKDLIEFFFDDVVSLHLG